jgi:hypothetical protein
MQLAHTLQHGSTTHIKQASDCRSGSQLPPASSPAVLLDDEPGGGPEPSELEPPEVCGVPDELAESSVMPDPLVDGAVEPAVDELMVMPVPVAVSPVDPAGSSSDMPQPAMSDATSIRFTIVYSVP